jgi:hypothetical protein
MSIRPCSSSDSSRISGSGDSVKLSEPPDNWVSGSVCRLYFGDSSELVGIMDPGYSVRIEDEGVVSVVDEARRKYYWGQLYISSMALVSYSINKHS